MTTINVSAPAGGRARFRHRTPSEALAHYTLESIPGSIDLPPVPESDYYQVTLRREQGDGGQWSETFAVRPPATGTHALEDLDRLPLGEAAAGGFALAGRVADLEGSIMPVSPWSGVSARMDHVPGYGPVSDLGEGTYTATGPDASAGAVRLQLAVRTHGQEATVTLSAGSRSASSALPASDRWHLVQLDAPAGSDTTEVQVQAQGRVLLGWPSIGTGVERSA